MNSSRTPTLKYFVLVAKGTNIVPLNPILNWIVGRSQALSADVILAHSLYWMVTQLAMCRCTLWPVSTTSIGSTRRGEGAQPDRGLLTWWVDIYWYCLEYLSLPLSGTRVPPSVWDTCLSFSLGLMSLALSGTQVPPSVWDTIPFFSLGHMFLLLFEKSVPPRVWDTSSSPFIW